MFKDFYNKIKDWFKRSETIFLARLEAASGFVIGAMNSIDWSPLLSLDFTHAFAWNQYSALGGIMLVKSIITELARRRNATDL